MASKKEWSKDETIELINIYEENAVLWNSKCKEYRNRENKDKILKEISAKFNCTAEEIQRKLHNLRNQVSQELKKIKNKKSGDGADDIYVSNWPYFKALKFLVPILTVNQTKSSMSTTSSLKSTINVATSQSQESQSEEQSLGKDAVTIQQDEGANRTVYPPEKKKQPKRKQKNEDDDDQVFKQAMAVLLKEPNEDDNFGQYVAMELKGLRSDFNKKRLKTEIRKAIVRIVEEEDNLYADSSSSTRFIPTSASSASNSSALSPLPSPQQQLQPGEANSMTCTSYFNSFDYAF